MKHWIFVVDDNTWPEHLEAGIAAINKPPDTAGQQAAMAEISGINPGDHFFFNLRVSPSHPPQVVGLYEATTKPYYDPGPLFPGAKIIGQGLPYDLPYRVAFKQLVNYKNPLDMSEIWLLREEGLIWSIQQSRGDAIGIHACISITPSEAKAILRMLEAANPIKIPPLQTPPPPAKQNPLPLELRKDRPGNLHYEDTLKALLLQGLADGKFKDVLGDYDDFIPNFLTGARLEIDILLLKYSGNDDIAWYGILEAKAGAFTLKHLQRLLDYERWFIRTRAMSPIQVHPIALAYDHSEILEEAKKKRNYNGRGIRLVRYKFDQGNLNLSQIST